MWRMQEADRTLTAAEWAMFRLGVKLLSERIEQDIEHQEDRPVGVAFFDDLTAEQKLLSLARTTLALCDPSIPTPIHNAANESTIAAVFFILRRRLRRELRRPEEEATIRRLLLAIANPADRDEPLPAESSTDRQEWARLVEEFEGRIFWDRDFEMGEQFLDMPPEQSAACLRLLTIDPDYFLTTPNDSKAAGLASARRVLERLLGEAA